MKRTALAAVILSVAMSGAGAWAQGGAAARAAARELVEKFSRRAGVEGAEALSRELAEFGGEAAVREALERVAAESGEATMRRAAALAQRHGLDAVRAVRRLPAGASGPVIEAVEQTAPELVGPALRALAREGEGEALAQLTARFGPHALEAAARHPGVGTPLVQKLGAEGVELSRTLSTNQAMAVTRQADAIAALPAAERRGVLHVISSQPAKAAAFLDKHPKFFLIAGAGALLATHADTLLEGQTDVIVGPDGQPMLVQTAGLVERSVIRPVMSWLVPILAVIVAGWGAIRLWGALRRERSRGSAA
ncbi:MAG: hypothetical protein IBJ10_10885 [Phycisphaerales bacterium]|nr:hypothetical protein [Phycisphaerales bacterium]